MTATTILVTGATGNVGRQVVSQLLAGHPGRVRALTCDPATAALPGRRASPAVSPVVETVTGAPARTYRSWAADHAADHAADFSADFSR
ncbi:NmrA family NAD(P)-binding protein [Streptomyces sparsogenes]|uniref:NmrA family NAD(P)-binding protein n=1 Tax=Streptomyces sparsogenes TaxID=67365 RepID=UPI000825A7F0